MIKQLSVFLENTTGALGQITKLLYENNINLRAINIAETTDYGLLRIVADNTKKSFDILNDNGFVVTESTVVAVAVPDIAGGLNALLDTLTENKVNIEYMYSIFGKTDGLAYMIFKVEDAEKAEASFVENGFTTADGKALGIN